MVNLSARRVTHSLSLKLGLAFATVVLVAVGCMGAYAYVQDRRNAVLHESTELRILSAELATRIDRSLATGKGLVGHLASTRNVAEFLGPAGQSGAGRASFQAWLDLQVGMTPGLSAVFIMSPAGLCLASSDRAFVGHDFSFRPYFQEAVAGRLAASDWMIGSVTHTPRIFSAAPVRLGGRIQGVLVTEFLVDEVEQAVRSAGVNGRTAVVINAQGIALAHSVPALQYHALAPLDRAAQAELRRTRQFLDRPIPQDPLSLQFVAAFRRVQEGRGPQTVDYRLGRDVKLAVLSPLAERPWVASVAMPEAEILMPIHRALVNTLLVGLATTLGAFLVAFGLGRWLLGPLRQLSAAMGRFGAGDAGARAPVRNRDERGRLAGEFNAMADALQVHRERLEELVKARTQELSRSVAEYRRAEEVLRESNQRLELATTSGSLGIWDRNLLDGTEFWNDRMFAMYGLERRAGNPDYGYWSEHILHPGDRQGIETAIQAAIRGERPYDLTFRVVLPGGAVHHIKSDGQVLRDGQGRAVRIIGINRDTTRQVEAEAEQRRLREELLHSEKLESLGSLAGGVAHDLNNVLAAILGMASVLRADCPDQDPRAMPLDTITSACVRGRDVVRSLLYFARKDLETMGPVDLNLIAREMVQLLSHTTLRRVQIRTDFQEPLGLLEGDAGVLSHALINLCVNAVDAMPQGGTLTVSTRRTAGGDIQISIQDTGEGMSQEVARRATEPFFTTKPMGKGTGLGLAMVYGTVKAHRGAMEIRSEPGQGTGISLTFPPMDLTEPAEPAAPAGPSPFPPGPARILLVDDDELIRLSVGPMLIALGHTVQTAEDGQEALNLFAAGLEVDLVILDMNMPGLNGAETLPRLLALRPGQPVLMATGYSLESIAPLLEGRPNVHCLRKPFSLEEIRLKLEAIGTGFRSVSPDPG